MSARQLLTTQTQLMRFYSLTPSQTFAVNFQKFLRLQSTRHLRRRVFARFLSDGVSKRDGDGEKTSESNDALKITGGSKLGSSQAEDGSQLAEGLKDDRSIESMLASKFINAISSKTRQN